MSLCIGKHPEEKGATDRSEKKTRKDRKIGPVCGLYKSGSDGKGPERGAVITGAGVPLHQRFAQEGVGRGALSRQEENSHPGIGTKKAAFRGRSQEGGGTKTFRKKVLCAAEHKGGGALLTTARSGTSLYGGYYPLSTGIKDNSRKSRKKASRGPELDRSVRGKKRRDK